MKKMNVLKKFVASVLAIATVGTSAVLPVLATGNEETVMRYD